MTKDQIVLNLAMFIHKERKPQICHWVLYRLNSILQHYRLFPDLMTGSYPKQLCVLCLQHILLPKEEVSNIQLFIFFKEWIHLYKNYQFMWSKIQKCLYQHLWFRSLWWGYFFLPQSAEKCIYNLARVQLRAELFFADDS